MQDHFIGHIIKVHVGVPRRVFVCVFFEDVCMKVCSRGVCVRVYVSVGRNCVCEYVMKGAGCWCVCSHCLCVHVYVEGVMRKRLYDRRAAKMLPVLGVSSPQLDDKHLCFTDRLHSICDARLRGPSARIRQSNAQWQTHIQRNTSLAQCSCS